MPNYGIHLRRADTGCKYNLNDYSAIQIFTHGPRSTERIKIDYVALAKLKKDIYVHGSYLVPWNNPGLITHINDVISVAGKLKAKGVVLHIGSVELYKIVRTLQRVRNTVPIILEMTAGHPTQLTYETPEKMNRLISVLGKNHFICVDTAHIWAGGIDISSYKGAVEWLNGIARPDKIKLLHVNGSSTILNGGVDVHQIPFSSNDEIWSKYSSNPKASGFHAFIEFAKKYSIVIIFEINACDQKEYDTFVKLLKSNYIKQ